MIPEDQKMYGATFYSRHTGTKQLLVSLLVMFIINIRSSLKQKHITYINHIDALLLNRRQLTRWVLKSDF